MIGRAELWLATLGLVLGSTPAHSQSPGQARSAAEAEVLAARAELDRAVEHLRLPSAPAPYQAELRMVRAQVLALDASYGGLITDVLEDQAVAEAQVRVGSLELDDTGFWGGDELAVRFEPAMAPAPEYLRRRLWLSLDRAFRVAIKVFARKKGVRERLMPDVDVPDRAPGPGAVRRLHGPRDPWDGDRAALARAAREASRRFREWVRIDNGDVHVAAMRTHEVYVDTDGVAVDWTRDRAVLAVVADTQAEDGMRIDHGRAIHLQRFPQAGAELEATLGALTDRVLRELDELVAAPRIDEEYDGPILFEPEAAAQLLATLVPGQATGTPPPLSESGRMVELEPAWLRRLGKNVLPPFLDLHDDPLAAGFGHYELDAEGVRPVPLRLVTRGRLDSLLMTRTPNRQIRRSNGRARMTAALDVGPSISNLSLVARRRGLSKVALERELLRRAREDGYEFAYVVELLRDGTILGPVPRDTGGAYGAMGKIPLPVPARLWRIEAGGRRTLVRGALLAPVSLRVLRRIRAVGRRPQAVPLRLGVDGTGFAAELGIDGVLSHTVDVEIRTPALILDGLELLVERGEQERPPDPLWRAGSPWSTRPAGDDSGP